MREVQTVAINLNSRTHGLIDCTGNAGYQVGENSGQVRSHTLVKATKASPSRCRWVIGQFHRQEKMSNSRNTSGSDSFIVFRKLPSRHLMWIDTSRVQRHHLLAWKSIIALIYTQTLKESSIWIGWWVEPLPVLSGLQNGVYTRSWTKRMHPLLTIWLEGHCWLSVHLLPRKLSGFIAHKTWRNKHFDPDKSLGHGELLSFRPCWHFFLSIPNGGQNYTLWWRISRSLLLLNQTMSVRNSTSCDRKFRL